MSAELEGYPGQGWVPDDDYEMIKAAVPIFCVDLLVFTRSAETIVLIERETYDGGVGLNLVGGAVRIDEDIVDAVERHVLATLGPGAALDRSTLLRVGVYQYFRAKIDGRLHDPRKNAVSLTFSGVVDGPFSPCGEAIRLFEFNVDCPPSVDRFGFGQGAVVVDALRSRRLVG